MATREASTPVRGTHRTARVSPKSWMASWTPRGRTEAHQSAHRAARRVFHPARRGVGIRTPMPGPGPRVPLGLSHHVFLRRGAEQVCRARHPARRPRRPRQARNCAPPDTSSTWTWTSTRRSTARAPPAVHRRRGAIEGRPTLVPIMVGALSTNAEATYGEILAPYLDDDANLFIVSSDFCHWGKRSGTSRGTRAGKTPAARADRGDGPRGMEIIESKDARVRGVPERDGKHHMRPAPNGRAAPDAEKERWVRQDEGRVHQVRAEQRGDGLERQQRVVRVRGGVSRRVSVGRDKTIPLSSRKSCEATSARRPPGLGFALDPAGPRHRGWRLTRPFLLTRRFLLPGGFLTLAGPYGRRREQLCDAPRVLLRHPLVRSQHDGSSKSPCSSWSSPGTTSCPPAVRPQGARRSVVGPSHAATSGGAGRRHPVAAIAGSTPRR